MYVFKVFLVYSQGTKCHTMDALASKSWNECCFRCLGRKQEIVLFMCRHNKLLSSTTCNLWMCLFLFYLMIYLIWPHKHACIRCGVLSCTFLCCASSERFTFTASREENAFFCMFANCHASCKLKVSRWGDFFEIGTKLQK